MKGMILGYVCLAVGVFVGFLLAALFKTGKRGEKDG